MPVPSAADFDRLRRLVAIADPQQRSTRPVEEVFTGREIATIPVGTAADVAAAIDICDEKPRSRGPRGPSRSAPASSSASATSSSPGANS